MADEIKLKAPTVEQQVVVNIQGEEKLRSFADTLEKISSNKNLQKYWKTQRELINDTTDAYNNFSKKASQDNAKELIKVTNALKAMAGTDLSDILPDFDKIAKSMLEAQKVAGNIDSAFSVKGFKEAFDSFEMLKAYGVDIQNFFSHFGVSADVGQLQKNVRALEDEVGKLTRRLLNAKNANEELRNEFENFKTGSGFSDKLDELDNLKSEMSYIREEAEETFRQFLKLNNVSEDGYDRDRFYDDNRFREYFENIQSGYMSASDAIQQFKREYAYLLEESFKSNNDTFGLEQLQAFSNKLDSIFRQVEDTSNKINDIISNGVLTKSVGNLSVDSSLTDSQRSLFGNLLKDEESLKSITVLFQKLIEESNKSKNNELFNSEQLQQVLYIFDRIENSLSSLRSVISDVGDGEEFSPLLKMINNVQTSISELSTNVKGIGLNMNIDIGSDEELDRKLQTKVANALQAYQKLFNNIKMNGAGGAVINQEFFDFNLDNYDTAYQKLKAIVNFIKKQRDEAKKQFDGYDILYENSDKSLWKSAQSYLAQVTKAETEIKKVNSGESNPLENLFGNTKDLSGVIEQLNNIVEKLNEISSTASSFKEVFTNGFNVTASVEEIDKLTNRVKELEEELSKVKLNSVSADKSNISSANITPIEEKIQDVGNGTKRIISEIGMSYDDFIKKVKSDNSLEERFAVFDKYGKVIESLKGDINSLVLPDNLNTSGAAKIVHTHPSMNALGGTLSEDDYLQWYSKFLSKGIGEQFELLWRGKSLNIDLSNVREELRSSVIAALVNISHVAGLQLEKSDGEIPLPLSDIYNSLSNGLLKNSVEKSGGTVSTEILDETKNKVQNIEALISILDDFGNFRRINLGNDDAIVERIEQYKSVLKFLSEHEEYTYDEVQKILAYERMTIIGTNSQGLTHNGMQLKNNTAEWMSEYLADSYSRINNLSVNSSNFDPFNMSSDAERSYADITCKYYDAIAEAMDYVVRDALEGNVSENDFVSSAMSSIAGEIGSLDDDEMLKAFLESKEHVQEYIQTRFDALKTSMDASPMIEIKKDEQSVEEQSKETANAIDEMIAKFSSTEIENMAEALTRCLRGLADFDGMAKSLGVTVDDLYTAQDIFNNKDLFNSLSQNPIKDVFQGDDEEKSIDALKAKIKEIFTDVDDLKQVLKSLDDGSYFDLSWVKDSVDTDNEAKVQSLIKVLEEYGYTIKNLKNDSEAWFTSGSIVSLADENDKLEQISTSAKEAATSKEKFTNANKEAKASADETVISVDKEISALEKASSKFESQAAGLATKPDDQHQFSSWKNDLNELNAKIDEYNSKVKYLKENNIVDGKQVDEVKKLRNEIEETINVMTKTPQTKRGWTDIGVSKATEKVANVLKQNTKMSKEARDAIRAYYNELKSGNPSQPIDEILVKVNQLVQKERELGRVGKSFGEIFKEKVIYGGAAQLAGMVGFYDVINIGREGFQTIRELDTALVDLKKTTAMNSSQLEEFYFDSNDVAKQMGVTTQAIIDQASAWSRLGLVT